MRKEKLTFAELIRAIKNEVEYLGLPVQSDALFDVSLLWESAQGLTHFSYIWCICEYTTFLDYGNMPESLKSKVKARYQIEYKRKRWTIETVNIK